MSQALRFSVSNSPHATRVTLEGFINEDFEPERLSVLKGPLVFDFAHVKAINSLGIRKWVGLLKGLSANPVTYENCPVAFSRQLLIVPSLKGHARVGSIIANFFCDPCDREDAKLVTAADHIAGKAESLACSRCKAPMEPDLTRGKLDAIFRG